MHVCACIAHVHVIVYMLAFVRHIALACDANTTHTQVTPTKIPGTTLLSSIFELRSREKNVRPSVGPCGSHELFRATWAIFALHPEGSQMTLFRWSEPWFSAPTQPIWSRPPPMDAPWAGLEGGCPPFSLKMGGFGARDQKPPDFSTKSDRSLLGVGGCE